VHVLFDAVRRLGDLPGWRLVAYGAGLFVEQAQLSQELRGLPVDVPPPFDPVDGQAVFAATDVLVVPSVMRETYSLVTREALRRGISVVCTDSLGPEEVVVHGHNGLVVPTADAESLAAALARLLTEPRLLERLREGCREIRVRSVEDQVAGLDRLYGELLRAGPHCCDRRRSRQAAGSGGPPGPVHRRHPRGPLALPGPPPGRGPGAGGRARRRAPLQGTRRHGTGP